MSVGKIFFSFSKALVGMYSMEGVLLQTTSEKMTPCDGTIKGDTIMYLLVEGGKMLKCRYENNYR